MAEHTKSDKQSRQVKHEPGRQTPDSPDRRESAHEHGDEHREHATQHGKGKEGHKHS